MSTIGHVEFTVNGQVEKAVLHDGWRWECADREALQWLQAHFRPEDYSPADGHPGVKWLKEAAFLLAGKAILAPRQPSPPGTVH